MFRNTLAPLAALVLSLAAASASAETIIVTLGPAGGPLPRPDRAQSSNLLVVNGTPYLIVAGDGIAAPWPGGL